MPPGTGVEKATIWRISAPSAMLPHISSSSCFILRRWEEFLPHVDLLFADQLHRVMPLAAVGCQLVKPDLLSWVPCACRSTSLKASTFVRHYATREIAPSALCSLLSMHCDACDVKGRLRSSALLAACFCSHTFSFCSVFVRFGTRCKRFPGATVVGCSCIGTGRREPRAVQLIEPPHGFARWSLKGSMVALSIGTVCTLFTCLQSQQLAA